mmetsp:Transcript_17633/g.24344  ORF Transcript_17633/g.24344 Transcript_17633/m.24344 type:complete len:108 (-) Transcript_17633:190-513(-)|eukprot:CAMPEP_0176379558 /NCGR_PEP_ID=MMETSP0126-20121128/30445_1 /TAXON_ID=141414 ORGANISM="Strombidinopsis acuminatum, Strain SPMC142" /NCGR_SAMPLE_ID=MMETSP0126 /ASSEMBLY_ACC=CAM_ASM_000229 /LENGTH=107 /DNA_ID=CAMNT_0017742389 /DNA_START=127 /DNA_END=450 /DNA_ORIENTATION=+
MIVSNTGKTPLLHAATNGSVDMLNVILACAPDINATDTSGRNALHLSAQSGNSGVFERLLQIEGIDGDAITNGGETHLMCAMRSGNIHIVAASLNSSCNPFVMNVIG